MRCTGTSDENRYQPMFPADKLLFFRDKQQQNNYMKIVQQVKFLLKVLKSAMGLLLSTCINTIKSKV